MYELCTWLLADALVLVWPFGYLFGFGAVPLYLVLALAAFAWTFLHPPGDRLRGLKQTIPGRD
jgi:hypothetical protein